ncbi:hypothetical protein BJI49_09765 [Acetobacter pasteurianus]|uniref:DUF3310 domain-containing protein n=1 Tax=Acetobacter pasteurianus TaxID=438 RepID=UPI0002457D68|nr:DUF3310 domain-containing protein [Acetobacter pasteurianus]RCL05808.1 hypothetical protein BJI49_09765 [Acetobacter pasteurianus]GAB31847.1 hypothetical protein APS_2449 [Acetobacter pasteurianus subsp. pasteurianus LMG 1262 = NBRC 106471]GCD50138.1 hypothetical protein NBRC106471_1694 [Acetobacter pasteurianus subsp. pasteurianus LMG 1262 = NBRC 106471]
MNAITPDHYKTESGLQVWDVTRYMSGNMAQAFQYVYRAGHKGSEVEDLRKAVAFLEDWVAHPDVPRSVLPEGVEPTDGPSVTLSLLLGITDQDEWDFKNHILTDIVQADSYEGETVSGDDFCGRKLISLKTLPQIKARITALEGGGNG